MQRSILISGVGGSGKTATAAVLKDRGYETYDMEESDSLFRMVHKTTGREVVDFDAFDNNDLEVVKQHDWNIDRANLQRLLAKQQEGIAFYSGIASNLDEVLDLFTKTIILVASPETIVTRLKARKDGEHGHTQAVRDWVLSWKDWWEDHAIEKGAIAVNADGNISTVVDDVIAAATAPN